MTKQAAGEPHYEVVWPLGRDGFAPASTQARVADLSGKTVAEFWDYLFRGDEMYQIFRNKLIARYPGIKFVGHEVFGNLHGPRQRDLMQKVPELLKAHKVDAVISSVGA